MEWWSGYLLGWLSTLSGTLIGVYLERRSKAKVVKNTSTNSAMTKCSCCEDDEDINTYRDNDYKFCPYCGAALRQ